MALSKTVTKFQQSVPRVLAICLVLVSTLLSSGCSSLVIGLGTHHRGLSVSTAVNARHLMPRQTVATRNNKRIKRRVRRIFADYRGVSKIKIKVNRGLVVLRGNISSLSLERSIIKRVSRIRGVHTIRSKMRIKHVYNH